MLTIRCSHCHKKLLKYEKFGKGRLIHCWTDRIKENNTIKNEKIVLCPCGQIIGKDEEKSLKLHQSQIIISGKTH